MRTGSLGLFRLVYCVCAVVMVWCVCTTFSTFNSLSILLYTDLRRWLSRREKMTVRENKPGGIVSLKCALSVSWRKSRRRFGANFFDANSSKHHIWNIFFLERRKKQSESLSVSTYLLLVYLLTYFAIINQNKLPVKLAIAESFEGLFLGRLFLNGWSTTTGINFVIVVANCHLCRFGRCRDQEERKRERKIKREKILKDGKRAVNGF